MMNLTVLNLVLWVPFVVLVLITAAIFLTSGYKRGLLRSLISLAATAGSAVLSVLIAKLVAPLLAKPLAEQIPMEQEGGIFQTLLQSMVQGLIAVVISLVLFSLLMLIFSIILKIVCNRIPGAALETEDKGLKWAGLGIRLVDAVLFALLLAVPLYGTLASYLPTVQTVLQFQSEPEEETQEILEEVTKHPVVRMSGAGPCAWVYRSLSSIDLGEGSVNVVEMTEAMEGMATRLDAVQNAPDGELLPAVQELISYTQTDIVEQDWCYDLVVKGVLTEVKNAVEQELGTATVQNPLLQPVLDVLDMDKESFQENSTVLLGFASYVLENGYVDPEGGLVEEKIQSGEFIQKVSEVVNSTEELTQVKDAVVLAVVQSAMPDASADQAKAYLEEYVKQVPAEQLQEQEAIILTAMLAGADLGGFSAIPGLGGLD